MHKGFGSDGMSFGREDELSPPSTVKRKCLKPRFKQPVPHSVSVVPIGIEVLNARREEQQQQKGKGA
eukprot:1137015-Pelagomonas_calceolata.AAC.7